MNQSELLAMIDVTIDIGQPVPTLDDYTEALDAIRELESRATFTRPLGALQAQQAASDGVFARGLGRHLGLGALDLGGVSGALALQQQHAKNRALLDMLGREPRK